MTISALLAALLVMMPWWPDGESFGIDVQPSIIERLKELAEANNITNLTATPGDATEWPASSGLINLQNEPQCQGFRHKHHELRPISGDQKCKNRRNPRRAPYAATLW